MRRVSPCLWLCSSACVLALAACAHERAPNVDPGGPVAEVPEISPRARCSDPNDGCPCSGNQEIPCYTEARQDDGSTLCGAGARVCENGVWSACRGVHSFRVQPGGQALIEPGTCSTCQPHCRAFRDRLVLNVNPAGTVLDPEVTVITSGDLIADPVGNRVTMRPLGITTTDNDDDGDCIPNSADCCRGPGFVRRDAVSSYGNVSGGACP